MADDSHLPSPGDVLVGKYRIERLIGRGGMGAVFAAQHLLLNQRVALKLLLGELVASAEATARFLNEARAAARIQGEHVARVLDIGQLPSGAPFMVLEYLEGADLADVLHKRGPLPVQEVADYALQALDALAQAHAAGIVHRDLKPANLFLTKRHDGSALVKVLDFGISKNLAPGDGQPQGMTSTRAVIGSPEYMSPEQLRTPRDVDPRTDLWSLGVILYELLSGLMPFKGESLPELFVSILESTPPPISATRRDVPPALEAIVLRCMARDRTQRFANVGELAGALLAFASDQTRAMAAIRYSASGSPAPGTSQPDVAPGRTANTAAPWANTGTGTTTPRAERTRLVSIVAVAAVCLLLSFVGVSIALRKMSTSEASPPVRVEGALLPPTSAPPSSSAASLALSPQPPSPQLPPPTALAVASPRDAGPAPSPSPARPATTPASPPAKFVTIQPPAPGAPFKSTTSPAATPPAGCTPNYYFDRDGNKHFKPECFR